MIDKLNDIICATLFTAFSYLIAFEYISGFYSYFNVPSMYIDIEMPYFIMSLVTFSLIMIFVYYLLCLVSFLLTKVLKLNYFVQKYFIGNVMLLGYYILYHKLFYFTLMVLIANSLWLTVDFLLPLLNVKEPIKYRDKILKNQDIVYNSLTDNSLLSNKIKMKLPIVNIIIPIFMVSVFFSNSLGEYHASSQVKFVSLDTDNKKYIVLGNYKEKLILKEIDSKNKTLNNSFKLYEVKDDFIFTTINNRKHEFFNISNK